MTGQKGKHLNLYFLFYFRSEKAKITYWALWLVFGGIATALQDRLQPPRHRLHQVPQVLTVILLEGPEPHDFHLQLRDGCGRTVLQLALHPGPAILDGVSSSVVKIFPPMLCL